MKPKSTVGKHTAVWVIKDFLCCEYSMFQSSVRSKSALVSATQIAVVGGFIMKKMYTALFCCTLLLPTFSDRLDQGPNKVEFFDRL